MKGHNPEEAWFNHEFSRFFKTICYLGAIGLLGFVIFLLLALFRISSNAFYTYESYNEIPYHRVGLLLGTSSNVAPGQPNEFFTNRILATVTLFKKGKIDYILVSGDNRHPSYNEPRQMMRALLSSGIPQERIVADYAGFSTIDSVIRAKKVFMLNDMTIISQDFHNERALFIARENHINAIGFNAANPDSFVARFKVYVREFFARIKCVFDVYLLNSQPTFLGDPIAIGDAPLPKLTSNKPKLPTSKPKKPGFSVKGLEEHALQQLKAIAKKTSDSALILRQQEMARKAMQKAMHRDSLGTALQLNQKEENLKVEANPTPQ